jgi:hypothetical protein
VPVVVDLVKKSLDEGKCCVIGLQSTGEASSERSADEGNLDDINSTAASNFTRCLELCHGFLPAATLEQLRKRCEALALPANPLDEIIHKLGGPDRVAEMTGRKKRFVKRGAGWEYMPRCKDKESDELTLNIEERKSFQDGRKRVAIIRYAPRALSQPQKGRTSPVKVPYVSGIGTLGCPLRRGLSSTNPVNAFALLPRLLPAARLRARAYPCRRTSALPTSAGACTSRCSCRGRRIRLCSRWGAATALTRRQPPSSSCS